ncbi:MAG: DnaJ domain-containing protein [Thermodesulfovibrionales bacterium]|nr:DnaJ domain-containing protein [Thermodesulfovibrionales bacterium]
MNDINRYFEILGLKPGASFEEAKEAYKDLVKVWHPDRFAHDPTLQQKAQEKLKEINEAYEKLKAYYAEYSNQPPPKEEYQSDSSYQTNDSYQENMGNKNDGS